MRADRDEHRVEAALVPLGREVLDPMIAGQPDAHGRDPVQLDIQHVTGQPVARNAVPHHPAGYGARVADLDLVAEARQMVGGGQSARPRADDQDSLAGAGGRRFEHPAALASKVAEEPLHRMDRYGAVEMGSVADGFTRVVAHPAVDCGEWVVRDEPTPGLLRAGRRWHGQARLGCSRRRGNRHCRAAANRRRRVGARAPARPGTAHATGPEAA